MIAEFRRPEPIEEFLVIKSKSLHAPLHIFVLLGPSRELFLRRRGTIFQLDVAGFHPVHLGCNRYGPGLAGVFPKATGDDLVVGHASEVPRGFRQGPVLAGEREMVDPRRG